MLRGARHHHRRIVKLKPRGIDTLFLGLGRVEHAVRAFAEARVVTADQLTAFELIPRAPLV
jgi:hypothetical protein